MPLKAFLEKMKKDAGFRKEVYKEVLPGLVAAAKSEGHDVSEKAYRQLLERHKDKLSDEQLEAVSGGHCSWIEQCGNGGDYLAGN